MKAVKSTKLEDHIDAVRISRFQFQGPRTGPTSRIPTLMGLDTADVQLFVRNDEVARGLVDATFHILTYAWVKLCGR